MLTIEILHNLPELQADLTDLMKQQLPFATSLALNATIKDVRRRIVFSTWPKAFTVRNKPFPGVVFRMKFSNKSTLEAMVFDQLGRDFIERHVTGGTKRPVSGYSKPPAARSPTSKHSANWRARHWIPVP